MDSSHAPMDFPFARMEIPNARMGLPNARMGLPNARMNLPFARMGLPFARMKHSSASIGGGSAREECPPAAGAIEQPEGRPPNLPGGPGGGRELFPSLRMGPDVLALGAHFLGGRPAACPCCAP